MIYRICWLLSKIIFRSIYLLKIKGIENIPATGAFILAANHNSLADPPLVGSCIKRKIYYIAKKQLFDIPVFGWIIKKSNAFPVDRESADISAFKTALKILSDGNGMLIFPEGTRKKTGPRKKLKRGVAVLAANTGAPVIPVAIINNDLLPRLCRLQVIFGKPMRFDQGADYELVTSEIMREVDILKSGVTG
ncbi:MAG: 1-acyl-sn-glycerol-3-phosphate acyltransferase [Elusimicrobia bacterium ADurb.Bin231]|nr:MAG: 1-acyl-sn-glycerol-3-phosphate acyltransferase [Elusimicrobia bacterium ADurb.Bin231]